MATENLKVGYEAGQALLALELNQSLDHAIAVIKQMAPRRENSLAITKIEEAQMWLEKGVK